MLPSPLIACVPRSKRSLTSILGHASSSWQTPTALSYPHKCFGTLHSTHVSATSSSSILSLSFCISQTWCTTLHAAHHNLHPNINSITSLQPIWAQRTLLHADFRGPRASSGRKI